MNQLSTAFFTQCNRMSVEHEGAPEIGVRELLGRYRIIEKIMANMKLTFPYKVILTGSGGLWLCGMLLDRKPKDLDVIVHVLPEEEATIPEEEKLDMIVKALYEWKEDYTTQELRTTGYCSIDDRHKFIAIPIEKVTVDVFVTGYDIACLPAKIAGMFVSTPERTYIAKCGNLSNRADLAAKAVGDLTRYHTLFDSALIDCKRIVKDYEAAQETLQEYADKLDTEIDEDFIMNTQGVLNFG